MRHADTLQGQRRAKVGYLTSRSWDRTIIPYLRDGLIDMLQTCVASEDAKEATCSTSLYFAIEFIKELNKELEDTPP